MPGWLCRGGGVGLGRGGGQHLAYLPKIILPICPHKKCAARTCAHAMFLLPLSPVDPSQALLKSRAHVRTCNVFFVFFSMWSLLGRSQAFTEIARARAHMQRCFCVFFHVGPLGAILRSSWGLLGPSWGLLGRSWGHLGALLGPSWGPLGGSWGPLGAILRLSLASQDANL